MVRFIRIRAGLIRVFAVLALITSSLTAQATPTNNATVDALEKMRVDLAAQRYATVIAAANGLLESARAIPTPQRMELFQLLAAAYYPDAPRGQQPDSALLPLAALIRLAPDITIAKEYSWAGLDELTERTRAGSFAAVSRPRSEYILSVDDSRTAHLAVVASRRTRFQLTSVADSGGLTVMHDTSAYVTAAALRLRTHDIHGPIFKDGWHTLSVWAYDLNSRDSVQIVHRVRAIRDDRPTGRVDADARNATANEAPLAAQRMATPQRASMLWGGLALAAATAVMAQEARPDDGVRAAYRVDARAFVVGAVMATAAVANFFTSGVPTYAAGRSTAVRAPSPPLPKDSYRVRLQIDPVER